MQLLLYSHTTRDQTRITANCLPFTGTEANEAAATWVNTHVPVKYLMCQSVLKSGVLKDEILPVLNYCVCAGTEGSPAPQQPHRRGLMSTQPCSHTDTATDESSEHFWDVPIVVIPSKPYGFPHMMQSYCVSLYLNQGNAANHPLWAIIVLYILSSFCLWQVLPWA